MKKAFSFVELVVSLVILGIVFIGSSRFYLYLYQNYDSLKLFERLYALENELYKNPKTRALKLHNQTLQSLHFTEEFVKDAFFEFKQLKAPDKSYTRYFKE